MDELVKILEPAFPYFTNMVWIIVALSLMGLLLILWVSGTIKKISHQKAIGIPLIEEIIHVCKKASYIPEDKRDFEVITLYKEFANKIRSSMSLFPLYIKNNGIRVMSKSEYDYATRQKPVSTFSFLIFLLAILYGGVCVLANLNNLTVGLLGILTIPAVQILLSMFVGVLIKAKNSYRLKMFALLKNNTSDFLLLAKPYILVDAYPHKFGKKQGPLYRQNGDLTEEQVNDITEFLTAQQTLLSMLNNPTETPAQNETVVDNEITQMQPAAPVQEYQEPVIQQEPANEEVSTGPTAFERLNELAAKSPKPAAKPRPLRKRPVEVEPVAETEVPAQEAEQPVTEQSNQVAQEEVQSIPEPVITEAEPVRETEEVSIADNTQAEEAQSNEINEEVIAQPVQAVVEEEQVPVTEIKENTQEPHDEFSLDAIDLALDQELESRKKKLS